MRHQSRVTSVGEYSIGCDTIQTMNEALQLSFISLLKTLPDAPGVYRFLDEKEQVLYIGKARNLKRRVSSYFQKVHHDIKTTALLTQIKRFEVTITRNEKEALLLEEQLIKAHLPRYNVLLKDDKSYPFVSLSHHAFPRLAGIRAKTLKKGDYFGPYPSMYAVKSTIELLQKIFKLRSCEDVVFKNRSRPCLLYQIKRCSGPCVNLIEPEAYTKDVENVRLFLAGKSRDVLTALGEKMDEAAHRLDFEAAARLRDQLKSLRELQESQIVSTRLDVDVDMLAVSQEGLFYGVDLLEVRNGRILGSRNFYFKGEAWDTPAGILQAFVEQYYFAREHAKLPKELVVSHPVGMDEDLAAFFSATFGRVSKVNLNPRGIRLKWLGLAALNATEALSRYILEKGQVQHRLKLLQERLGLTESIRRIECFDISHTQGEETVASCVVFDEQGINKKAYRRFNITGIQKGDDYAAMHQVLLRRLKRLSADNDLPDVMLIDGGKGQLSEARKVIQELNISGVRLIGVAKGRERKAGTEELWLPERSLPLYLDPHDPAFHLIQQIRDEAHRFAITGHRKRRDQKRSSSHLEEIPGIGAKRRAAILKFFGGWQEVKKASYEELQKVPGVSPKLAQVILSYFNQ